MELLSKKPQKSELIKSKESFFPVNNHIVNAITPIGIEFNKTDFWFGDQLSRIILVTNYPTNAEMAWISRIANMESVTCSIHLKPTNSVNLIKNIDKSLGEVMGKLGQGGLSTLMKMRYEKQYKDGELLLTKIDQEQENVFYVSIVIMVSGRDKDDLDRKSRKVESALAGSKMRGRIPMNLQREGLLAVGPYNILPEEISDIAYRNMPSSTVAGAFPFNHGGINDGTGFIFGVDSTEGIILIDTWLRGGDRTNSNWFITGLPGVGKSATVKHIFLNEYSLGSKIIMIDPDREYKELCENVQGQRINAGGGAGGRINILQVKKLPQDDEDEEDVLYKDEGKGLGDLALHFQTLRIYFKLYSKDLDTIDMALLEEILEELYLSKGITWNTDISNIPNDGFPIMEELYYLTKEKKENKDGKYTERMVERLEKIEKILRSPAIGADSAIFNGHTTIEAKSDFIVLDTHNLLETDDTTKRAQYFNILTWAWQECSRDREEKVLLGVDEGYLMVDPEVPQALQFLRNFSKRIRKYGGGLAFITHSVVDVLDKEVKRHGQALIDNACWKFFMGTDGKNLKELSELMDLTETEEEMLNRKRRGHGLLMAGSKRFHAIVQIPEYELELFGKGGGN